MLGLKETEFADFLFRAPGAMPKPSWAASYRCRDRPNFPPFPTLFLQPKTWVNETMEFPVKVCWIWKLEGKTWKYDWIWKIFFSSQHLSIAGCSAGSLKIKSQWIHFPTGKGRGNIQSKCWFTIHSAQKWMNSILIKTTIIGNGLFPPTKVILSRAVLL